MENRALKRGARGRAQSAPPRAEVVPQIYDRLRGIARRILAKSSGSGPVRIEPTVLVHEALLRLLRCQSDDLRSHTQLLAVAATAMRHVLTDQARYQRRLKRGSGWKRVTLAGIRIDRSATEVDVLGLDEALTRLATVDERAAHVVELRFFAGASVEAVAQALDVSVRTVRNDWTMARAWLRRELGS